MYLKTLTGLLLGLNATLKVTKKANIYTTVKETGGRQKDRELVGYEFLVENSPLEMGPPLQDFAQRARLLGVDFEGSGQACVDLCCQHRNSILLYVPKLWIGQDLAHLEIWRAITTILSVLPNIFFRKNLLVKIKNRSQPADSPSRAFRKKVIDTGTHHIFLVDRNLRLEEILYSSSHPKLLDVFSKHEFGLVKREKQFTGVDLDRYKSKRKELLQTLKPDDIEHHEVIVMAVMNGTVVMNGELPVDSDVEMEVFPKAPADSPSRAFRKKVIDTGTHHIFLVDRNLRLEEILYSSSHPKLLDVFSKHEFGLVKREKQFTGVDLDRYKSKRKELLQTLKPDDIEHHEVIVMAVMNGTVVMNGELPVDSDVEMEVFPKAKPENTPLQHSAISSSCLPEKRMATQLDSEDDATTTLAISSKHPHLNRELLEPDIKPPLLPSFWNFIKSNQSPSSTSMDVEAQPPPVPLPTNVSQSRTSQTFTSATGTSFADYQEKSTIQMYSDAFWKLAACRLQFKATSSMMETQLKLFAENYNNPQLILNPVYYNAEKGVPKDKIICDGLVLKSGLFAIEKDVASRIQRVARGDSIKPFWKLQMTLPPPVKVTYMKPTKKGNLGAVKTCGRCKKQRMVPYPLPKTNLRNVPLCKNMLGKWSTDENAVKKFFTDIKDGKVPDVDQSVEMVNMRVFMAMTWVEEKMDWVLTKERLHIEVGKRKQWFT
ncbi:hypothetical protein BT69DRAFT_1335234 [Atractiella rhizophila]|nr:hypothetical protein BT69DRAFT_1335234 [Atractiella rhizophila]